MMDESAQRQWFRETTQRALPGFPGLKDDSLKPIRDQATEALERLPVINRRQEAWRYTGIDTLLAQRFYLDTADVDTSGVLDACSITPLADAHRLVFVNGYFAPHLSNHQTLPDGVTLGSLRDQVVRDQDQVMRWLAPFIVQAQHLFNALNSAVLDDGVFLHVSKNVQLDRPIELLYLGATREQASLASVRNLIVLEAGAQATIVEQFAGEESASYFHNGLTEILLEEGALLNHVRIQNEAHSAWHLGSLFISLHAGSHYRGVPLMFGGAWSRTEYQVSFDGEDAGIELDGLYTVGGGQLSDIHLNVGHSVPSCTSRVNFRGLLYGKGRAVFDGCIRVGELAQHTDAQLRNDNLMLAPDAEIDTKPRLEIDADDVKCSHGTTVGQLDAQQLFYLRSRGFDEAAARTLLAQGFASEIIHAIDHEALRERADELLHGILESC